MPVIAPLVESNDNPLGNVGDIAYTNVPAPPVAVTGVTLTASYCVTDTDDTCEVNIIGCGASLLTDKLKVLLIFWLAKSLIFTVNVVSDNTAVGVPVISPVDVLKFNPVGKDGLIEYVNVLYPPDPCTGIYGVT